VVGADSLAPARFHKIVSREAEASCGDEPASVQPVALAASELFVSQTITRMSFSAVPEGRDGEIVPVPVVNVPVPLTVGIAIN
jgi:hypothetical protein